MWLTGQKLPGIGGQVRPPNNAASAIRAEFKQGLSAWLEQKDMCVSLIYKSVQGVLEALETVEQYIREKEILPGNNPNNEVQQGDGAATCQFHCWGSTHTLRKGSRVFLPKMWQ